MGKILIIDNYDSFTYNLYQLVKMVSNDEVEVHRNDQITIEECDAFDKIILSPGPGIPEEAGRLKEIIAAYVGRKPIFGVCLGQQAIGEVFGAKLKNLSRVFHGIRHEFQALEPLDELFRDMPSRFFAGRYHSWVIDETTLPDCLQVTCRDDDGEIMAIAHKDYKIRAVQFHPESVMTDYGKEMMTNFLKL